MNVRDFREEIAEAYLKGIQFTMQSPLSDAEIKKAERVPGDGVQNILLNAAQTYARERVLANAQKLDSMP